MKKILVILMMVLLCSTVSMAKSRKHSARKPKAKNERAMTEFEKRQKEEYLNYLLIRCKYWYNEGDIEFAEQLQKDYEENKYKNYYIKFRNVEFGTEEEKEYYGSMGIDTLSHTVFIKSGFVVSMHFNDDGKCVLHMNDADISRQLEIIQETDCSILCGKTPDEIIQELVDEINEASGYNAKVSKKKKNIEGFLNEHNIGIEKPTAKQDAVQKPKHPFSETSQANRRFYQQHKSDYTKRK